MQTSRQEITIMVSINNDDGSTLVNVVDVFSSRYLGDPSDQTLRKVEIEVMIPKLVRERSKVLKCSEQKKAFDQCCLDNAMAMVFRCREENRQYQQCLNFWFNDKQFVNECKEIYLKQRAEFRSTGIKRNRKLGHIEDTNDDAAKTA
ncbi:COX assembly mitochondrial protein-like protein [Euroglyphus maynei]|uniref:COX assembly mitochondrial protein n=1 Tax=Euroglyphus maynei TaxID=6958 RepID=A0A1Y3BMF3_EURMA|nr:COX assembly mitochondrial protein-like protein [Euroglyphus maynei]